MTSSSASGAASGSYPSSSVIAATASRHRAAGALEPLQDRARARPPQERAVAHLVRDRRGGERLLERLRTGVDPVEHRDLLERDVLLLVQTPHRLDDGADLGLLVGFGAREGRWSGGPGRAERLAEPAEPRREPVGELEHLGRRAVVLLEPHHRRVRVPRREPEQVRRRRAGERVDRLVVVADDAEVVAIAEPAFEQAGLERVHVLVLVHGERREPRPDLLGGLGVLVEQPQREPEHVLEIEPPHRGLAPLVAVVDAVHQVGGDRRLVVAELAEVPLGRDHPVLRPLDLAGELAPREELVRRRERVRERGDDRRLVVEDLGQRLAGVRGPQPRELRERRRVERARLDALDAERREPRSELPGRLVRERHREDLRGLERPAPDLAGDPVGDRGGLAGPGAGQDRDRASERESRPRVGPRSGRRGRSRDRAPFGP